MSECLIDCLTLSGYFLYPPNLIRSKKQSDLFYLQQELEKNMAEKVQMALEERDKIWNIKMAEHEEAHSEILQSKVSIVVAVVA